MIINVTSEVRFMVELQHVFCSGSGNCPIYNLWVEKDSSNPLKIPCVIEKYEFVSYSCIASQQVYGFEGCERILILNKLEKILNLLKGKK